VGDVLRERPGVGEGGRPELHHDLVAVAERGGRDAPVVHRGDLRGVGDDLQPYARQVDAHRAGHPGDRLR
jgi:hypothetical protein